MENYITIGNEEFNKLESIKALENIKSTLETKIFTCKNKTHIPIIKEGIEISDKLKLILMLLHKFQS